MKNCLIDGNTLTKYAGNEKEITLSREIRRIGDAAFANSSIANIVFCDDCLKIIGKNAFSNCLSIERIKIPTGVVEIDNRAFSGCTNLGFVDLPSSLAFIGKEVFIDSPNVIIVGEEGSVAEKYAKDNNLFFQFRQNASFDVIGLDRNKGETQTKVFEIYGERIECSNSAILFFDIKDYYESRRERFVNGIWNQIPKNIEDFSNHSFLNKAIDAIYKDTAHRIKSQGINITEEEVLSSVLEPYSRIYSIVTSYFSYVSDLINSTKNNRRNIHNQLISDAQDKAKGLSYGVIGDSLDIALYSIDNIFEKKKQLEHNYYEAGKLFAEYINKTEEEVTNSIKRAISQIQPVLLKEINLYIDACCKEELKTLEKAGRLDIETNCLLDREKSTHYLSLCKSLTKDKDVYLALALKYNPVNMEVYEYAFGHDLFNEQVRMLASFVDANSVIDLMSREICVNEGNTEKLRKKREIANHLEKHVFNAGAATIVLRDDGSIASSVIVDEALIDYSTINMIRTICQWKDVCSLCIGSFDRSLKYAFGLKEDGTVVFADTRHRMKSNSEWKNIKSIHYYEGAFANSLYIGITYNGSIVFADMGGYDCRAIDDDLLTSIQQPVSDYFETYLFNRLFFKKQDGSFEVSKQFGVPVDNAGEATRTEYKRKDDAWNKDGIEVSKWRDIQEILPIGGFIGVKKDGTILTSSSVDNEIREALDDWQGIVSVFTSDGRVVGLTESGRFISTKRSDHIKDTAPGVNWAEISSWSDIAKVYIDRTGYIYGLREDGKILSTSYREIRGSEQKHIYNSAIIANGTNAAAIIIDELNEQRYIIKQDGKIVAIGDNITGRCNVESLRITDDVERVLLNSEKKEEQDAYIHSICLEREIVLRKKIEALKKEMEEELKAAEINRWKTKTERNLLISKRNRLGMFSIKEKKELDSMINEVDSKYALIQSDDDIRKQYSDRIKALDQEEMIAIQVIMNKEREPENFKKESKNVENTDL